MSDRFKIVNLYHHREFIPVTAQWIYKAFIENRIDDCSYEDIVLALENRCENEIPLTWVALLGEQCAGTVSLFSSDLKNEPDLTPWLAALFVAPEFRKMGLGDTLVQKALRWAGEQGFSKLWLRTETAGVWYKRLGWSEFKSTVDEHGIDTTVYFKKC